MLFHQHQRILSNIKSNLYNHSPMKSKASISKTKRFNLLLLLLLSQLCVAAQASLSLRTQNHNQISSFADVINYSNHINSESVTPSGSSSSSDSNSTNVPTPKIAAGIIIPIICIGICFIFCFFCLKCAKNQQDQAQQALQQIPCYCGPIKCLAKCCRYLLCIDIILRCLGFRSTSWEKKEKLRLQQEQQRRQQEERQRKKYEKDRQKYQKKYSNLPNAPANPYQTQMRREQLDPASAIKWNDVPSKTESQRVKKQICKLCEGKNKQKSNIVTQCSNHCVFHLECLIAYKNQNSLSKTSNFCPSCQSNYFNIVQFYCQKCWNKSTEIQIESGNVYVSQLDSVEVMKSIGGQKCDQCAKKKWFWQ